MYELHGDAIGRLRVDSLMCLVCFPECSWKPIKGIYLNNCDEENVGSYSAQGTRIRTAQSTLYSPLSKLVLTPLLLSLETPRNNAGGEGGMGRKRDARNWSELYSVSK